MSYLQYPMLLVAVFYAFKPYFHQFETKVVLESVNNLMIFMGLGISFSTLQDTRKTSIKFEKRIWENPKRATRLILGIGIMTFAMLLFGGFGYFVTDNNAIQEVSFGAIVLGIGFLGFLKAALEVFENHQKDKKSNQVIVTENTSNQ